jgi:hypothetical protein
LPVPLPFLEVDDVLHVGSLVSLARNCETKGQSFHETGKIFHGRNR